MDEEVKEIAQEVYDVAFALNHALPSWDQLPEETKEFVTRRAIRIIEKLT